MDALHIDRDGGACCGASSVSRVVQDDTHLPLADNFILKDLKNNIREMAYILIGEHP